MGPNKIENVMFFAEDKDGTYKKIDKFSNVTFTEVQHKESQYRLDHEQYILKHFGPIEFTLPFEAARSIKQLIKFIFAPISKIKQ